MIITASATGPQEDLARYVAIPVVLDSLIGQVNFYLFFVSWFRIFRFLSRITRSFLWCTLVRTPGLVTGIGCRIIVECDHARMHRFFWMNLTCIFKTWARNVRELRSAPITLHLLFVGDQDALVAAYQTLENEMQTISSKYYWKLVL